MELLRERDVPRRGLDVLFRESRLGKTIALLVFSGLAAAALAGGYGDPLPGVDLPVGLLRYAGWVLVLFALVALKIARSACRPSNWLLRFDGNGAYVKFRSYLNHHFPGEDLVVVHLPAGAVEWIRRRGGEFTVAETRAGTRRATQTTHRHVDLELKLAGSGHDRLAEALLAERERRGPMRFRTRSRAKHYPVRLGDGGVLRLEWRSQRSRIAPGIDAAVETLSSLWPTEEARDEKGPSSASASREERERVLLACVERGQTFDAVRIARRLYGFDTTEAARFVEKLTAGGQ